MKVDVLQVEDDLMSRNMLPGEIYALKSDQPITGLRDTVIKAGTRCHLDKCYLETGLGIISLYNGTKVYVSLSNLMPMKRENDN